MVVFLELMQKVIANIACHRDEPVGVALSGGIDSSTVLHEVCKKNPQVYAYTMRWGDEPDEAEESEYALRLCDAYGAIHRPILFDPKWLLQTISTELRYFDRPRWNLWPLWILEQAKRDGVEHLYVGEGCDEILGYSDRCYIRGWISQIEHIFPVWKQSADLVGMNLHAPFLETELSLQANQGLPVTINYHCGISKEDLWNLYKDQFKAKVIYPKKAALHYYNKVAQELGCEQSQVKSELMKRACLAWANTH